MGLRTLELPIATASARVTGVQHGQQCSGDEGLG